MCFWDDDELKAAREAWFVLFDLILYVPSTFSVKQGRVFLGWTSTKLE